MGRLTSPSILSPRRALRDLSATLEMIQFEHTIFALPFALMGAVLAAGGIPGTFTIAWILLAMVAARSAAMTFNRLADQPFDARNPRTSARPLVTGRISRSFAWTFLACCCVAFVLAAARLNRLAFLLSFPVLALILGYSYAKRVTWGTHLLLGASLGCAPLGAWIGVRGAIQWPPVLLGAAVLCWTAGFDILYACQDVDFDRRSGLHSIPRRWGVAHALRFSRILHALMIVCLIAVGRALGLGLLYHIGVAGTAVLLIYEHSLVRAGDLSRVNRAFFTVNGCVSIFLFVMTLADLLARR
ncbi:MAG TPA: UbiA-like polyprenyltransferase [Candidatus Polarisedimenticolia bacterium]|jgi:4-hydroxybenzoate polyprenyltransferase|nr:UbiA-like polyprenyltransferase [Candidatus Polarisedimenticolia bacterium]